MHRHKTNSNSTDLTIIHVVEAFGGGVLSSVALCCNGMAERGHSVFVVYSLRGETPSDFQKFFHNSIEFIELNMVREVNPLRDIIAAFKLHTILKSLNPTIIHLHSSKAGVLGRLAALPLRKNKTTYYSPRGLSFLKSDSSRIKRKFYLLVERIINKLGGTIIACSKSEKEELESKLKAQNVILVENAVDLTERSIKPKTNKNDEKFIIGTSGRLSPQKNPLLFAKIAKKLQSKNIEFIWIGGGDDVYLTPLKDSRVKVTGWLDLHESTKVLQTVDIYLQTSLWEGMPLSLIEAQILGIPTIVSNVVGNRDVVKHDQTGFICNSEDDFIFFCDKLINNQNLILEMGETAKKLSNSRFSKQRLIEDLSEAYGII